MSTDDVDGDLRRLARDPDFPHRESARNAIQFRKGGNVTDLLAIEDDPHPCAMTDAVFALACSQRPWLNWVPMPTEAICQLANELGARRARGDESTLTRAALTAVEPPSAMTAGRRVIGPLDIDILAFPAPDLREPLRTGQFSLWRYDGMHPVPIVPLPSTQAVQLLHQVATEPWASPQSGYLQAAPLGELPLDDLLGLLAHLPEPPATPRWRHLAEATPTYWYRFLQPWVCLAMLHQPDGEHWATSTRRQALVDLAFGIEDWVADSALFALVTAAYRDPGTRVETRHLVRSRLDAATSADRLVTIEESLAQLMLITPGCDADDAAAARAVLAGTQELPARTKRRWWQRGR